MGHHHDEHHGHGAQELTFTEKGGKLLQHWIQHNNDHIGSYLQWADEFRANQLPAVADLLTSAVELTKKINQTLAEAATLISPKKD